MTTVLERPLAERHLGNFRGRLLSRSDREYDEARVVATR
jgi:hypothetical protein